VHDRLAQALELEPLEARELIEQADEQPEVQECRRAVGRRNRDVKTAQVPRATIASGRAPRSQSSGTDAVVAVII
jgi:hypothetical protein